MKDITQNAVTFNIQLSPSTDDLKNVDFSQLITTNLTGVNLTFKYNSDSTVGVIVQYSSPLQNNIFNLQIDIRKSGLTDFTYYGVTNYSFFVDSTNNCPVILYDPDIYTNAQKFSGVVAMITCIFLSAFVFSLFSKSKYIGVEMMGVCQVAFLGLMNIDYWEPSIASFTVLGYSNGYNANIYIINSLKFGTPRKISGLNFDAPMVHNFNYALTILLMPLFVALILYICYRITELSSRKAKLLQCYQSALG
jgi:hypothetical protein